LTDSVKQAAAFGASGALAKAEAEGSTAIASSDEENRRVSEFMKASGISAGLKRRPFAKDLDPCGGREFFLRTDAAAAIGDR
jgi:hypothetical protein